MKYAPLGLEEVPEVVECLRYRKDPVRSGKVRAERLRLSLSKFFYGHLVTYCGDLDPGCRETCCEVVCQERRGVGMSRRAFQASFAK
jgi:hypothetical protein